ncbi:MAG: TetR/AcrR family transcriptional regulator [Bacteroidales bacterium]|nr:TetR/AcrR family transcriptional regulator [Bacteroidales bacterium]MDD4602639.1 TetR/AcrR family transcriptional regulator [Bacteroidales bacterium]
MDTKQYIIKTAFGLFLERNYNAVTLNEISKISGLSKGAFYHYFKSKEEVFIDVIDSYVLNQNIFEDPDKTPKMTLKQAFDYALDNYEEKILGLKKLTHHDGLDPHQFQLILEASKHYPGFIEKLKIHEGRILMLWENIVLNAKESHEIRDDIDTSILIENIVSIGSSLFKHILYKEPYKMALSILRLQYYQLYQIIKAV